MCINRIISSPLTIKTIIFHDERHAKVNEDKFLKLPSSTLQVLNGHLRLLYLLQR